MNYMELFRKKKNTKKKKKKKNKEEKSKNRSPSQTIQQNEKVNEQLFYSRF